MGGLPHDQERHQVLEHGSRPGDERRPAADGRQSPAEVIPVPRPDVALGDGNEARQPGLGGQEVIAAGIEAAVGDAVADGEEAARGIEEEPEVHGLDQTFGEQGEGQETTLEGGLRHQGRIRTVDVQGRFEVPSVAPDGVPGRPRPDQDLGRGSSIDAVGEGGGDVQELLRLGGEILEAPGPIRKNRRGVVQNGHHPFRGLEELRRGDRLRTLRMLGLSHRLDKEVESVPDALQDLRAEERAMGELAARLRQGEQVPGQVAAVHGGNVDRLQRIQVPGVVPVAEVASDSAQPGHGLERSLEPLRQCPEVPIHPKSWAAIVLSRYRPMFVGEVR